MTMPEMKRNHEECCNEVLVKMNVDEHSFYRCSVTGDEMDWLLGAWEQARKPDMKTSQSSATPIIQESICRNGHGNTSLEWEWNQWTMYFLPHNSTVTGTYYRYKYCTQRYEHLRSSNEQAYPDNSRNFCVSWQCPSTRDSRKGKQIETWPNELGYLG